MGFLGGLIGGSLATGGNIAVGTAAAMIGLAAGLAWGMATCPSVTNNNADNSDDGGDGDGGDGGDGGDCGSDGGGGGGD